jgi:hypothetical protein
MTAPDDSVLAPYDSRRIWEDRLAGPMFFLAVAFLVVLAGLIHRYPGLEPTSPEAYLIVGALGLLWLVFVAEAVLRFRLRDRTRPTWKSLRTALAGGLLPPLRMGCQSQARPNHLWLPGLGWQEINSRLRRTLERFFSVPMICFALLVLPVLVLQYYAEEKHPDEPVLALWAAIGTSVIWLAFAVELIIMVAVSDRPWRYCAYHWIDVVIVALPVFEAMPLLRLARLGRVLRLEQLLRWGRLHRLQALMMRGWRAFLVLQIVQRLSGHSLERRRQKLMELVLAKQEEVADLRREIAELDERIARKALGRQPAVEPPKEGTPVAEGSVT